MINNTIYLEVFDISGRYYNVLQTGMNKSMDPLQQVPLFAIFNHIRNCTHEPIAK